MLLVSIVPIGLFAATLLYLHGEAQESGRERSQTQTARMIAAAVDNSLDSTVERLSILARLWATSPLSSEAIYAQAKDALQANVDWRNILAFRADGAGVFRADAPFGTDVPPDGWRELCEAVVAAGKPLISDVSTTPEPGIPVVAVAVPVVHDARVTDVLVATLNLNWYDRLLRQQGPPERGLAGVFDRQFKFVARSVEGDARRGGDPTPELVADMKQKREGIGRYTNLEGISVYTAWTFSRHGWGVAIATPSAPIDQPFWSHLLILGTLWAAAVALSVLYAISKARLVTASLDSLERQAEHVAAGQRITDLPASRVVEIDRALAALERASELLQTATQQRNQSLATEREARAAAEAASHAKDEFLAMLGHELRNPLAAIVNAGAVLAADRRSGAQVDFAAGVIARQSQHLKRLIDDLLDVGRAITDKTVLVLAPLDLAACVRDVVATLRTGGQLDSRAVELDAEPVWIDGDRARIEQIASNLVVNAAIYSAPGGHIRLRVRSEAGQAMLRVSDDGRGIAPEHLPRVFDLFFQADPTVDRVAGGLGIGLTLVQRLVRLHGGEVSVESAGRGHGASFTVRLPAIAAPGHAPPPVGEKAAGEARTVLIVEDNDDARESLSLLLELQGHRVLQTADGAAAFEILRRERVNVALLDIGLPGLDGYQLARQLRQMLGRGVVLIALTGYGRESDLQRAMDAGFDRHLTKPVDMEELAQAISAS